MRPGKPSRPSCTRRLKLQVLAIAALAPLCTRATAQTRVPLQPFAQQVQHVASALSYVGAPLSPNERNAIEAFLNSSQEAQAVSGLQDILDRHTLAVVEINPESRVRVRSGPAKPELVEAGTRVFLVKVINQAGVTSHLQVSSPNAMPVYVQSDGSAEPNKQISQTNIRDRWMSIDLYDKDPMSERLSGLPVEYRIVEVYSRDRGQRSAEISFSVGQGTQDIGFRNQVTVLFNAQPAVPLELQVRDESATLAVAAFTIRDASGRLYPNPAKRLAPDFFFQPQIYRSSGQKILLPEGEYTITCSMGPEYRTQTKRISVKSRGKNEVAFAMDRWINPASQGWYSGDHHVHAAGCSHYQNPTEGVRPEDMVRQIQGERLNVGSVLTWGPCYYYQKQFFTGKDNPLSAPGRLMHYDLEVSGFPSSHAGHLVLLGLKDQDYPHCVRIEQWPTWDLPILRWARSQGALAGFAHSGWGLEVKSRALPNYDMPGFDGIGANEYIVDVTHPNAVDFISAADTPYLWELNIWYHTLNVGFRTRISGETDFPCITDARVGQGRVYAKVEGELDYSAWLNALAAGRSYVSDGRSHLMDFKIEATEVGTRTSEVKLAKSGTIHARVKVAAYLPSVLGKAGASDEEPTWMIPLRNAWTKHATDTSSPPDIASRPLDSEPYWHLERARIKGTRQVPVELVMNGTPVAHKNIVADGSVQDLEFDVAVKQSSWLAVRILGSSHTNPMFVLVNGRPIRASRESARWCLSAVEQCWTQKASKISKRELPDARAAYDHARAVYTALLNESGQ